MSALRDRVLLVAGIAFGAMWLLAAGSKLQAPLAAFELTTRAVPYAAARLTLAAVIGAEVLVGTAMVLRALRGLWMSLAGLAVASAALLYVRSTAGELVPCGCFGKMFGTTIDDALRNNAVLAAVHVALIVWSRVKPAT